MKECVQPYPNYRTGNCEINLQMIMFMREFIYVAPSSAYKSQQLAKLCICYQYEVAAAK